MLRYILAALAAIVMFTASLIPDDAYARGGRGGGGGMRGGGGFSGGSGFGGGMRGGGYGGGGMRAGSISGGRGFAGGAHPSHPIAHPGVGGPGYRPGYGYGYRPGYGWGAAAAGAAVVGAGLAYGAYAPYYGYDYGSYDEGAYEPVVGQGDAIAECARRFKTYDPASQTYIVRKGVRASCP